MGKYNAIGETIEGNSISCIIRKWTPRGLKKHPITNKPMTLYVTDRNSIAEILESRPEPQEQLLKDKTSHFHRTVGDTLHADALSVYVDQLKRLHPTVKQGVSHRHSANYVKTEKHTIAEIKVPLDVLKKLLGYSNNLQLENNK